MDWYKEGYNVDSSDFKKSFELPVEVNNHVHLGISIIRQILKWKTADGIQILIKDITSDHLTNILRYLRKSSIGSQGNQSVTIDNWIEVLKREQKYRNKHNL